MCAVVLVLAATFLMKAPAKRIPSFAVSFSSILLLETDQSDWKEPFVHSYCCQLAAERLRLSFPRGAAKRPPSDCYWAARELTRELPGGTRTSGKSSGSNNVLFGKKNALIRYNFEN